MNIGNAPAGAFKLEAFKKDAGQLSALDQVRDWTRERFGLSEDAAILVSEVACVVPGCPPLETVVAFWTEEETRHQFKLFKPVAEVVLDDLPPAWLKASLAEESDCDCC
jgi:nitrate reductase delta subunit